MVPMAALTGDLTEFDVASVLGLVADLGKTGELSFRGDRGTALLGFDKGDIVWSECSSAPAAKESSEVLFELLRFEAANFAFEITDKPGQARKADKVPPSLASAKARLVEWRAIEKVVPSSAAVVTLVETLPKDEVAIDQSGWDLIQAVGTGQSVASLGARLKLAELPIAKLVKSYVEDGLVELDAEAKAAADSDAEPVAASGQAKPSDGDETPVDADRTQVIDMSAENPLGDTKSPSLDGPTGGAAAAAGVAATGPTIDGDADLWVDAVPVEAAHGNGASADTNGSGTSDSDLVDAPGIDLVADETQAPLDGELPPPPGDLGAEDLVSHPVDLPADLPPPPDDIDLPTANDDLGDLDDLVPTDDGSSARSRLDQMASKLGVDADDAAAPAAARDLGDLDSDLDLTAPLTSSAKPAPIKPKSESPKPASPKTDGLDRLIENEDDNRSRWRPFRAKG